MRVLKKGMTKEISPRDVSQILDARFALAMQLRGFWGPKRDIRDMPMGIRHLGMTILERMDELRLYSSVSLLLVVAIARPQLRQHLLILLAALLAFLDAYRTVF